MKESQSDDAALWSKCPKCGEVLYRRDLAANLYVCTRCGYHFRMSAYDRIASIADGDFAEIGQDVVAERPAGMVGQEELSPRSSKRSRAQRALRVGRLRLCDDRRLSGRAGRDGLSLSRRNDGPGHRRAHCAAARRSAPPQGSLRHFRRFGRARMEEGMLALMQMAKTTAAVVALHGGG